MCMCMYKVCVYRCVHMCMYRYVYMCRNVCVFVGSCYVIHVVITVLFFHVGSGDSVQRIRLVWQGLLPAKSSNWPRILLSRHINAACVSTQICKSIIY